MGGFAGGTTVPVERTQNEIRKTIIRYGGDDVVVGDSRSKGKGIVQFSFRELPFQISINLPNPNNEKFWLTPVERRRRDDQAAEKEWEKECRRLWRVLLLLIKAKFEVIENEVMPFEEVFLPWLLLSTGRTIADQTVHRISDVMKSGGNDFLLLTDQ